MNQSQHLILCGHLIVQNFACRSAKFDPYLNLNNIFTSKTRATWTLALNRPLHCHVYCRLRDVQQTVFIFCLATRRNKKTVTRAIKEQCSICTGALARLQTDAWHMAAGPLQMWSFIFFVWILTRVRWLESEKAMDFCFAVSCLRMGYIFLRFFYCVHFLKEHLR